MARNQIEKDAQVRICNLLTAIQPLLGKLETRQAQDALLDKFIGKYNDHLTRDEMRSRLYGTIQRYSAPSKVKSEDVFKRPASEVLDSGYLTTIGFKTMERTAPKISKKAEAKKPAGSTKIKLAPTRKAAPAAGKSGSQAPNHEQGHASSAAGTGQANNSPQPGDGSSARVDTPTAQTPIEQDMSQPTLTSQTLSRNQAGENLVTAQAEGTNDVADSAPLAGNDILPERQPQQTAEPGEESAKTLQLANDGPVMGEESEKRALQDDQPPQKRLGGTEATRTTDDDLHAQLRESQQHGTVVEQKIKALEKQLEETEAARLVLYDSQEARLKEHHRRKEAFENNNISLKRQLEEAKAQIHIASGSKRPFEGSQHGSFQEPASKRQKWDPRPQSGFKSKINKEMIKLFQKLKQMVLAYYGDRDFSIDNWAELVAYPSPELARLYSQIFSHQAGHDWRRGQVVSTQFRGWSAFMRLIAADLSHHVFQGKLPWTDRSTIAQSLAGFGSHLKEEERKAIDDIVRDVALRMAEDEDFQNVQITKYARRLAHALNITLTPHLDKLMMGKPQTNSAEWFDELVKVYRDALMVRATIDTYVGEIEVFWPKIGSKMDPKTTDPAAAMNKDKPHEVCAVELPGLQLKLEGEPDIILSLAQVAAKRTDIKR